MACGLQRSTQITDMTLESNAKVTFIYICHRTRTCNAISPFIVLNEHVNNRHDGCLLYVQRTEYGHDLEFKGQGQICSKFVRICLVVCNANSSFIVLNEHVNLVRWHKLSYAQIIF